LVKRIFDIVFSFFGLIILSPVFLVIAILIMIKMPGRVFFRQERVGRNGNLFTLVKFRTMTENHDGNLITVKANKRITSLGSILRKYKLDELTELWNVIRGEMSFVGPRPDVPGYADNLTGEGRNILKLRPGITGPATLKYSDEEEILASVPDPVKYNNEVIFPDKVRLNLEYLNNHSLWGDIKIILRTIFRRY
jgi:lipopolysaccharide/colanic/teichoic acid biosynthesis glycosyltransferase